MQNHVRQENALFAVLIGLLLVLLAVGSANSMPLKEDAQKYSYSEGYKPLFGLMTAKSQSSDGFAALGIEIKDSFDPADDNSLGASWMDTNDTKYERNLPTSADYDWFKFNATNGTLYKISFNATQKIILTLYDTDATSFIRDIKINNGTMYWYCDANGTFFIEATSYYNNTPNLAYNVSVLNVSEAYATGGDEHEIDNAWQLADVILNNTTSNRTIFPMNDIDFFKFTAEQNKFYIIETSGSVVDTLAYLYGTDGKTLLAYNDDIVYYPTIINRTNSRIVYFFNQSGDYYFSIESAFYYQIGAYNVNLTSPQFEWASTNGTPIQKSFTVPRGTSHWFEFNVTEGSNYVIRTQNISNPQDYADAYLYVYDSNGTLIGSNDDVSSGNVNSRVTIKAATSGTYFAQVYDRYNGYNAAINGTYNFSITNYTLTSYLILPTSDKNITQKGTFKISFGVRCSGDCGNVTGVLDPVSKEETDKVSEKAIDSIEELSKTPIVSTNKKEIDQESTRKYIITLRTETPLKGLSVSSKRDMTVNAQDAFEQKFSDIKITRKMSSLPMVIAQLTPSQLETLSKDTSIKSVSEDKVLTTSLNESIPLIRANDTWKIQFGGQNLTGKYQTVCIIDSGANYSHPNLASAYLGGYDYVNLDSSPMDDNGHGTHVTGIIVSNNTTFKGVAPEAKFVALKAMDASGSGYSSDILASIDWCIANSSALNISVISMSLGTNDYHTNNSTNCSLEYPDFYEAINDAVDADITVVVASGNENLATGISAPACIDSAISVGAVDKSDNVASYSNSASILDLLAPGSSIYSTWLTGFQYDSGTSMAAPHVSGAALILNQLNKINYNTKMAPADILAKLNSSGKPIVDSRNGLTFSRIDLYAATSKGTVPMNSGSPFFTTSQNPRYAASESCLRNMVEGSTCNLTWTVNATGAIEDKPWSFFSIFYSNYNNDSRFNSNTVNITISSQNVVPDLLINTPTDSQKFPAGNISVNVTAMCNTSLVKNVTLMFYNSSYNSTSISLSESSHDVWLGNLSTQSMTDGNYTMRVTANNSLNLNSSSEVNFTVDVLPPRIAIVSTFPQNTSHPWINFTIDDYSNLWFSLDGGANETVTSNFTLNLTYPGNHRIILYANDSFSNFNKSAVNFTENFGLNLTNWSNAIIAASEVISVNISNGTDLTGNENASIFSERFNITFTTTNGYNVSMLNVDPYNASWWSIFHIVQSNTTLQNMFNAYGTNVTRLVEVSGAEQFFNATYTGRVSFGAVNFTSVRYCNSSAVSNVSMCSIITSNCSGTPSFCYNYSQGNLTVYVPHFSTIVVLNDSIAPKVDIISPQATNYYNESMYNITVNVSTSEDATSCVYSVNTSSTNYTLARNGSSFAGTVSGVKNGAVKFTAYCSDGVNTNSSFIVMYMNDSMNISISGPATKVYEVDTSSAKFKIYTNKDSNMTVFYSRSSGVDTNDDSLSSGTFTKTHTGLLLDGLASERTYYFFIQVCDRQDNCVRTSESSFVTTAVVDDNTSADTSNPSGGGTSSAPTIASVSWSSVPANTETNWLIVSSAIPVTKITFTLSKSSSDATMSLESYGTAKPSGILTSPNIINTYLQISSSMTSSVKSARIYFSVPKSWFTTNNYDSDKVRVYRLSGSDWSPLYTTKVGTSGSSYTYYADTPGFSFFAITTVAKEVTPTPGSGEGYADNSSVNQVTIQKTNFTCGDGNCSANETAQTCPHDCGILNRSDLTFFDKVKGIFEVYGLYLAIAGSIVLIAVGVSVALIIKKKGTGEVSEPEPKGKVSSLKGKEKVPAPQKVEHKAPKEVKKKEDRLASKMAHELKKGPGVFKLE